MEQNVTSKGAAGVSIVEILISMVLVAIALVAITTVFPSMNKNRKNIYEVDQARMLATEVLEGLQFYSVLDNTVNSVDPCDELKDRLSPDQDILDFCNKFYGKKIPMGSTTYTVTWDVGCGASGGGGGLNTAEISVKWSKGKDHEIKLSGILQ